MPGNEKALFQAAEKGDTTTVVALLEAGTNVNCRNAVCVCVRVCVCVCVRVTLNPKPYLSLCVCRGSGFIV